MRKDILGDWGSDLSDAQYGRALAALGVLEASGTRRHPASSDPAQLLGALRTEFERGDRTLIWRQAAEVEWTTLKSWRETLHKDTDALANAWQLFVSSADHPRLKPRLAIEAAWQMRPDILDFDNLLAWLGHRDTGCQALMLALEDTGSGCRTVWHWPLRVGIPDGPEGEALVGSLRSVRNGWIEKLLTLQRVGETRDSCDLLILPPGMAAELASHSRLRLRSSFVVCLDDPVRWSTAAETVQARLRTRLGAAGVALVGHPVDLSLWYGWFVQELSHDLPIHAALWGVGVNRISILPTILGSPQAIDRLRILAVAEHMDSKLDLLTHTGERTREMSRGAVSPRLSTIVRRRPFASEGRDGVPIADEIAMRQAEIEEKRQPRWIQAQIFRQDSGIEPAHTLTPEGPNLLAVHIGPSAVMRSDTAFPDSELDYGAGQVNVDVQIELEGAALAALMPRTERSPGDVVWLEGLNQELPKLFQRVTTVVTPPESGSAHATPFVSLAITGILLPAAGNSSLALFAVWPQHGVSEVGGRIAIICKNRIVQTARLKAPVCRKAFDGANLWVETESTIHGRDDDLDEMREGDAALIAADDIGGRLRLTVRGKGVELDNLMTPIKTIQDTITSAALRWDYSKALLAQPVLKEILYALAANGRLLYDHLQKKVGEDILEWNRLQLICRGNGFFPLEYVYAGPPPTVRATVCTNAQRSLQLGRCEQEVSDAKGATGFQEHKDCPNRNSTGVICPLHFWGFAKVIERYGGPGGADTDQAKIPGPEHLSKPAQQPFGPIRSVLCGASDRAFTYVSDPAKQAQERQQFVQAFSGLGASQRGVQTWEEWRQEVNHSDPNLLVLVVHTDRFQGAPVLEIGAQDLLGKHEITSDIVGKGGQPLLLLLLGCSTAGVTEDFASYPERFRDGGADIILAPLAPIRGADAVPIAKRIATLLGERLSGEGEVAFGELLRDLRRQLFAEGHPGVLGLVGFGDGDWVIGGQHV